MIEKPSTRDAVAIWLLLAVTYLVFAGSVGLNEGLAMLACATLGTVWWWAVGRRGGTRFRFDQAMLRRFGVALRGMPRQTVRVGVHLAKAVMGGAGGGVIRERSAAEVDWATPHGDTAPATRAIGLLGASLAPDSFVLSLDREHGTVTTHALEDAAR